VDTNVVLSAVYHILEKQGGKAEIALLKTGEVAIKPTSYDPGGDQVQYYSLTISLMPSAYAEQADQLYLLESNILSALQLLYRSVPGEGFEKVAIVPKLVYEPMNSAIGKVELGGLIVELEKQRDLMIAVATGGPRIKSVEQEYRERHLLITRELEKLGLKNTIAFDDLWKWYGHWSSGELPTYASRRAYMSALFDPLVDLVRKSFETAKGCYSEPPMTGWERVDRTTARIGDLMLKAQTEEDYQTIGLLCRENLISLSNAVYQSEKHEKYLDQKASETDAKRLLDAYLSCELPGDSNEEMRRFAKSAVALANALTHKRTADRILAGICTSATNAVIGIARIIEDAHSP
jgi:hypothetical protein